MEDKKYLIIVSGPTAVGKTTLALQLAQALETEIISADSRQFYRETEIGTAKPNDQELAKVKHYFINDLSIHDSYSVGDFERDALKLLKPLFEKHQTIICVGGSGLFIRALCEGLDEYPAVSEKIIEDIEKLYQQDGIEALQNLLKKVDPDYYAQVDLKNPRRLIRALSVFQASGQAFSSFQKKAKPARFFTPIYIKLDMPRPDLYERINQRVDQMMEGGLLEEAKQLLPFRHLNALQTVGYQELFDYLEEKTDLATAIELIKRNTRRYAKRQETWFRKEEHWSIFRPEDLEAILTHIRNKISEAQ